MQQIQRFGLAIDPLDHRAFGKELCVGVALAVERMTNARADAGCQCGQATSAVRHETTSFGRRAARRQLNGARKSSSMVRSPIRGGWCLTRLSYRVLETLTTAIEDVWLRGDAFCYAIAGSTYQQRSPLRRLVGRGSVALVHVIFAQENDWDVAPVAVPQDATFRPTPLDNMAAMLSPYQAQ